MHGLVLYEFKNYITGEYGDDAWNKIMAESELPADTYKISKNYPDNEVATLFTAASRIVDQPLLTLLEQLGIYVGPKILDVYAKDAVAAEWTFIDVIRNVQEIISYLQTNTDPSWSSEIYYVTGDDQVLIMRYETPLRICCFTIGIIKGIAQYFNEDIEVSENSCMLNGADVCEISIRRLTPG